MSAKSWRDVMKILAADAVAVLNSSKVSSYVRATGRPVKTDEDMVTYSESISASLKSGEMYDVGTTVVQVLKDLQKQFVNDKAVRDTIKIMMSSMEVLVEQAMESDKLLKVDAIIEAERQFGEFFANIVRNNRVTFLRFTHDGE